MKQFTIVLIIFFVIISIIAIAKTLTTYVGENYYLRLLSDTWDGMYNILSYGALIVLMFSFGISIQTSQRLKDDICKQCMRKILKRYIGD